MMGGGHRARKRSRMEMKLEKEVGYVTNLAVDGSARRSGIGATLLAAAESTAEDYGCVAVACRVDKGNDPALAMYDKNGYAPLESRRLREFRRLMGGLYAIAGVAHLVDLLVLNSVLPTAAGAPPWAADEAALAMGVWRRTSAVLQGLKSEPPGLRRVARLA